MPSLALARTDVIVGVDTHKHTHVAVAVDGLGGRLDEVTIPATNDGYAALVAWAMALGPVHTYAVEGCGSYGIGLARFLRRHGHPPVEVSRPPRAGARRISGKSDAIDAEHAARTVLSGEGTVTPKLADGQIEAIRLVKIARDAAVKARSTVMVTLTAVLVTASDGLRAEIEPLSDHKLVLACAALDSTGTIADPEVAMAHTLGSLAHRWLDLHEEIKVHTGHLKTLTHQAAPAMLDAFGVGIDIAAQMLITAGDNTERVHSEAAFAKLCGVCPIPTGSGRTDGTYRLNRGGNRQANAALYRAVIACAGTHPPSPTSNDAPPRASPRSSSSAASSAISSESSTSSSPTPAPPPPPPRPRRSDLTIYRSINAAMEAFWATVKKEICHIWGSIDTFTRSEMRTILFDYIEVFYNRSRHQVGLEDRTPAETHAANRAA